MRILLIFFLLINSAFVFTQEKQIILKASSTSVNIKLDDVLFNNAWTISPEIKPDIYVTNSKIVTFYTDLDSNEFRLKNKEVINFIIVLNSKDTAYTQIVHDPTISPNNSAVNLAILRKGKKYNTKDNSVFPKLTFQSKDDSNLVKLRQDYNLDSIAGQGNEVSKILNLMHWVHNTIHHDGEHPNPEVKNSLNMIAECQKGKRGLDCRGLAITLSECYLAMGIPSTHVTCLAKDTMQMECHVINSVYCKELKKWLYIDPTHDAYVMNEKGELLSIQEVRERLINGKALLLNPAANWNYRQSSVKEEYLYKYMSNLLYRMYCPISNEFDLETPKKGKIQKTVELLPLDADFNVKVRETKDLEMDILYIDYTTNNPHLFWEIPIK